MSFASVALLSKFTQYPRATGQRLPQEQRHQANHMMPPARTGHVIGFHQFSIGFFGKDFCLQLSLALQMGDVSPLPFGHIVACRGAVRLSGLILCLCELV